MSHQVNGSIETEEEHQLCRPPDIEQDMKEMERRKRVDMIMNSQVFREELERIIEGQMNEGSLPANLSALQQMTELLMPHRNMTHCMIPINDIRGVDGLRYTSTERLLRCKLAAVYRLVDLHGWSQNIYNHITLRVNQDQEHFLLNPFGLQYYEVTASSLLKVDMQGNVVDPGSTHFTFNRAGFVLHSAIHAARPDIKCVIHVHVASCVAVSAAKCGLIPMCQEAALVGDVSYHDYQGLVIDTQEREQIARDLGPVNKVMILRNHGIVTCGESVEEALFLLTNLVAACEAQVKVMPLGLSNIQVMSEDARLKVREVLQGSQTQVQGKPSENQDEKIVPKKGKVWDLEFEAQMRMLDNSGFRTGYIYKQPLIRAEQPRLRTDVELPPSASSLGSHYLDEDKWLSPLKKLMDGKKTQDKMRWVNSPNSYQKVEVLETGTTDPRKITRWVQEGGNQASPIKVDQQVLCPPGSDPNEFKKKQKELKENRLKSKVTAGPQSQVLDGMSWEEIRKAQDAKMSATGDQVVLVGAASKGIIQRDFQHNAMVYKSPYAKNPFDQISDKDLEEYRSLIEKKQRGEIVDEIPEHIKPFLVEPVNEESPPTVSDDDALDGRNAVQRSLSAKLAQQAAEEERERHFQRRSLSERKPKTSKPSENSSAVNGGTHGDEEQAKDSRSSKESSPVKESTPEDPSKKKNKKKGLRTPSFLKKKKHRKGVEA